MCLVAENRSVKYFGLTCQYVLVAGGITHGLVLCQFKSSVSP